MKMLHIIATVIMTTALLAGGFYAGRMTLPQGSTCIGQMPLLGGVE